MAEIDRNRPYDEAMIRDERAFVQALGGRIAGLRKGQHLTQAQLAQILGLTRQRIAPYQVIRHRVSASRSPTLAKTCGTSVEQLPQIEQSDPKPIQQVLATSSTPSSLPQR